MTVVLYEDYIESVQINEYNIDVKEYLYKKGVDMDLMTTKEMAEKWNVSARRVALLCSQGRIEGAFKKGKTWLIPDNAKKPKDPRKLNKL